MTGGSAESSRSPLWLWPTVAGVVAALASLGLTRIRPTDGWLTHLWPGDQAAASSMFEVVATAVVTVTTLTFSLTVVALQLASQQFSPRLLREVTRDRISKGVLSVLTAAFVFSIVAIRQLDSSSPVPVVSALVALLLGIAAFAAGLTFISHMTRLLRVDTLMLKVHDETKKAIEEFYPRYDEPIDDPGQLDLDQAAGELVHATASGYVRSVDVERLVQLAREHDAVVRIETRPGDHVVRLTPIATVWSGAGGGVPDRLADEVRAAVDLGYERTLDQDAGFGFRQLEDIAVKAVSPSINDPVTAATALGHMGDLLSRVVGSHLGPTLHRDPDGVGRAVVPDRDLHYYLELTCGQLRRFGGAEPSVLTSILQTLRDVAVSCRDDVQRAEIARAAEATVVQLPEQAAQDDADAVQDMRRRVQLALDGDLVAAYADRAGETRSI
ncbi:MULTISPECIES: DUF2254 domain-containing protein [unclassified Modestobacter]|uniref:DUF2254 domain-containing protein n=1 Tax=unclassified Modestobacter TaxID=2643866 RepID=UPI0022AACE7D|nr:MULTISPECIES: DUF2254 domain-containing protein [unclassified Modestobacter]MCZ2826486.1 DUF2254 domain-containing protein [Modestobacter sp. VKM Ac-2981]MCZ2852449.1 DUF2254 domain-containing protein [Modestobacter sp. VKM Ac-2982]